MQILSAKFRTTGCFPFKFLFKFSPSIFAKLRPLFCIASTPSPPARSLSRSLPEVLRWLTKVWGQRHQGHLRDARLRLLLRRRSVSGNDCVGRPFRQGTIRNRRRRGVLAAATSASTSGELRLDVDHINVLRACRRTLRYCFDVHGTSVDRDADARGHGLVGFLSLAVRLPAIPTKR